MCKFSSLVQFITLGLVGMEVTYKRYQILEDPHFNLFSFYFCIIFTPVILPLGKSLVNNFNSIDSDGSCAFGTIHISIQTNAFHEEILITGQRIAELYFQLSRCDLIPKQ